MIKSLAAAAIAGMAMLAPFASAHAMPFIGRHYGPAVLGAPLTDWMHQMGRPMHGSTTRIAYWQPCSDEKTPQIITRFGGGHAVSIVGQDCPDQPLDMPTRRGEAVSYMPKDAHSMTSFTAYSYPAGTHDILVYRSRSLGFALPALNFEDCQGKALAPGTFFLDPHMADDKSWAMGVGTCLT